jgi:hypothetical protein
VGRGADNRAVGRLESNWPRGSLRGLNLLLRLTQGLRPGLIYVAPSGLDFGGAVSLARLSVVVVVRRDSRFPPFAQDAKDGPPVISGCLRFSRRHVFQRPPNGRELFGNLCVIISIC